MISSLFVIMFIVMCLFVCSHMFIVAAIQLVDYIKEKAEDSAE